MRWQLIGNIGGKAGRDGKDIAASDVQPLVTAAVETAVKALPTATAGRDGRDGIGVTGAFVNRDGSLVLTLTDGSTKDVGIVIGRDGRDGLNGKDIDIGVVQQQIHAAVDAIPKPLNGKDGLGFDDLDLISDPQTGWRLRFVRGDQVKDFYVPLPFDTGVWKAGRTYAKGSGVTYKGAWWLAQWETSARPGDETPESRAWRLAVKGGRDGAPGAPGRDGIDR